MKFTTTRSSTKSVNVFVYGPPGYGKTRLCATAPNPIIISSEKGLLSIAEYNIPVIEIEDLDDLSEALDFIKSSKKAKQFETVCLDSISDIAETCLAVFKRQNKDPRMAYGVLQDEITDAARKFRDLKINTYVVGKSHEVQDNAGMIVGRPSMPSKRLGNDLPYMFDLVLPLRWNEEGEYYYLQAASDPTWFAKDRSGTLDEEEKPDLTRIFNKVKSKLKGVKDGKKQKG